MLALLFCVLSRLVCGKSIGVSLEKQSPCKVNLLLNILGRRADGFHELETVLHPVRVFDRLSFARAGQGIQLSCNAPGLPTDARNLVYRAAAVFLEAAGIKDGVRLELQKNIPLAAGLGGGSGNAATTLLGLNELFGGPLAPEQLQRIAASLGSDVPFFLQEPAGAGDRPRASGFSRSSAFPALSGAAFLLIHPGFGIATAWAYQQLARFPAALNGRPGRAQKLISLLQSADLGSGGRGVLQLARSAGAGEVSAAGVVPGIPPRQRRGGHADVRQRFDHLCRGAGPGGGGSAGGEVQGQVRPGELDGRGLRLTRRRACSAQRAERVRLAHAGVLRADCAAPQRFGGLFDFLLELLQPRLPIRPTGRPGLADEVGARAGPDFFERGQLALGVVGFAPFQIGLDEVQPVLGILGGQLHGALQMFPRLAAAPDAADGGGVAVKQPQVAIGTGPVELLVQVARAA